jgi:hypothetical protein
MNTATTTSRTLLLRAVTGAVDPPRAEAIRESLERLLSIHGNVRCSSAKPYWKIPGTFVVEVWATPVISKTESLNAAAASLGSGWQRVSISNEHELVFNAGPDAAFQIPDVVWAHLEHIEEAP